MALFDGIKQLNLPDSRPAEIEVSVGGADDRFMFSVYTLHPKTAILIETK